MKHYVDDEIDDLVDKTTSMSTQDKLDELDMIDTSFD